MKYIVTLFAVFLWVFYNTSYDTLALAVKPSDTNMLIKDGAWGRTNQIEVAGTGANAKDDLITVIKNGINRVLGLLALIALIILLWGGFQMVTAAGDEKKFDTGMTYLKQAAGWLIMIWVAWFLVSIIFYVIKLVTI
jgi:Type IV secretion system pilin